ncbi:MAG: hypothetical protein V4639_03325 [Pseudomonadota bacterium]
MSEKPGRIRIDWFRVIVELEGKGYRPARIAATIGWPRGTVVGWRNYDAEPSHAGGEALVNLWIQVVGPTLTTEQQQHPRAALPLNVEDLLSAARAHAPDRKKSGFQHAG